MKGIPAKTPKLLKLLFPNYTWKQPIDQQKKLFLTFDDGPIPVVTEFVLDQLHQYNAKATFFCIGDNIQKHPLIFQKVIDAGHSIGNHTTNHLKAWKTKFNQYIDNVSLCEKSIQRHYNSNTQKLFRPPYGQISKSKLKKLKKMGYNIILWDVLAKDWRKDLAPQICANNVIQNAENGSIIVFHDSIKAFKNLKESLPQVLEHFTKQGYCFEKI